VLEYAIAHGLPTENVTRLGMPDRLIGHAPRRVTADACVSLQS
jgi:hypothetical protein